jgi:phosphatidylglycerol---prolipoprotein diacylglyceryl transferase
MFIQNINPDLIKLGPFTIRFYGIVYALGFLAVAYFLSKAAEKKKIKNLDKEKAIDLVTYTMISAILGARIFHVVSDFYLYKNNLLDVFAIWKGGLGWYGGLFGAMLFIFFYCRKHKIDVIRAFDYFSFLLPLIIGFGRIANFINGEHLGFPASSNNVPWCVVFERIDAVCRHTVQLYESLSMFLLFILLLIIYMKWQDKKGLLFASFLTGYGIARFITDFYRETQSAYFFGLAHTQIISIIMIFIGSYYVNKSLRKVKK